MKAALLIPWWKPGTEESGYIWETTTERPLSPSYDTKEQALANKPQGYRHLDDAWKPL